MTMTSLGMKYTTHGVALFMCPWLCYIRARRNVVYVATPYPNLEVSSNSSLNFHDHDVTGDENTTHGVVALPISAGVKNLHSTKQDPRTKPKALLKLLDAGEKAKKQLSPVGVTDAPINIECLWEDVSAFMTRCVKSLRQGSFVVVLMPGIVPGRRE